METSVHSAQKSCDHARHICRENGMRIGNQSPVTSDAYEWRPYFLKVISISTRGIEITVVTLSSSEGFRNMRGDFEDIASCIMSHAQAKILLIVMVLP